jgi:hypothetical protein
VGLLVEVGEGVMAGDVVKVRVAVGVGVLGRMTEAKLQAKAIRLLPKPKRTAAPQVFLAAM